MSNLLPNPYNNMPGPPQVNANPGPQILNHNQQYSQVPLSQLPPGYGGLKQDANSNSPLHVPVCAPQNNFISQVQNVNDYNQSGSNSPAFNHPGMLPPTSQTSLQSSPMRPHIKPTTVAPSPTQNPLPPLTSVSPRTVTNVDASPIPYPPNFSLQQQQINDNAPPLIPSSHYLNQPLSNGPPMSGTPGSVSSQSSNQFAVSSSAFSVPPLSSGSTTSATSYGPGSSNPPFGQFQGTPSPGPVLRQPGSTTMTSQPNMMFPGQPLSGPPRNSPLMSGPPFSSGPPIPPQATSGAPLGPPRPSGVNGPMSKTLAGLPTTGPPVSGPQVGPSTGFMGSGPLPGFYGETMGPPISGPSMRPPLSGPPTLGHGNSGFAQQNPVPAVGLMGPPNMSSGPQSLLTGPQAGPPKGLHTLPPMGQPMGQPPTSIPPVSAGIHGPPRPPAPMGSSVPPGGALTGPTNMQSRYPQMPQSNYMNQQTAQLPPQPTMSRQYPSQYNTQGLSQQMGQLSVTRQGFDQLWGHNTVDLLQCRHILPEYPEDPPEIRLGHQFAESPNCSPDIFRCTINRIPESNSLLQKSRLPLGILIHPFKDLNHLPVIQCAMIVRCRACRTYINPFVYFVDAKRWKCNLCYRVNDLPEEFQYDPVSKTYGDPSRRPEIKSATIEFIAPAEYMLRPPQPAIYLFLMDVSQIARDSGYLQVMCETLKKCLDQLPGDARTQVGFICYDAHIHYYLMSDGLTRPKEMTVLDIDDVFLPSPESLLVNLGERRELVKELLTVLPQRHSGPGVPNSALGAALQAAYKLLAPTGGRVTVFQTCLPNIGPGALQPREDPNARSSKEVAHLNPATDFYKRVALDCSGAQVAVDLFLLSSQYCDLATLSGMSKFSGGSVYHIPLFVASRVWQADQFRRALTRYLTRKIGFEAVMRVRCTRGLSIHTFHGNFFVRSTDLLSLPNVSPDAGFGMQLTIEESLADLQQVCFQAALLYTSSKGERRIRVHTLALPIANTLTDVLHAADQQCIIGLLSKMAVDRCASASMSEAREALMNVAVDALCAHRLAQNLPAGAHSSALHAPAALRLLPLYLLALLKRKAFRTGTSTRLDDRVADMCDMKCMPLAQLLRAVYPDLYAVHALREHTPQPDDDDENAPDPPRMHLSAERINSNGAYLLDDGETMILYVCHGVSPAYLSETFGAAAFSQLPDEARSLPQLDTEGNALLHAFIDKLNDDRPYAANILIIRDNSPSRTLFTERLVDDRVESAFSYYEFLQHVKSQVK